MAPVEAPTYSRVLVGSDRSDRAGAAVARAVDVAERDGYDLLVVGDKGMRGIERLVLGSVPNKLSHHLPCSPLIVKTG